METLLGGGNRLSTTPIPAGPPSASTIACTAAGVLIGAVFGTLTFGAGLFAGAAISAACIAGDTWGWDN